MAREDLGKTPDLEGLATRHGSPRIISIPR